MVLTSIDASLLVIANIPMELRYIIKCYMLEELTNLNIHFAAQQWMTERRVANLRYGHIQHWDTSRITNIANLFRNPKSGYNSQFNDNIADWDVGNVTDMSSMFSYCLLFNQPLNKWNTRKVTNMRGVFEGCQLFNQPLDTWNTSNVIDMSCIFANANSFNQPLSNWNVSNVTAMKNMFYRASSLNQPLENWNVANVITMNAMFHEASRFNQPIHEWNISHVKDMQYMFCEAIAFNQPLDQWDTSNVMIMTSMFQSALNFNQPLQPWQLPPLHMHRDMFANTPSMLTTNLPLCFPDSAIVTVPWYQRMFTWILLQRHISHVYCRCLEKEPLFTYQIWGHTCTITTMDVFKLFETIAFYLLMKYCVFNNDFGNNHPVVCFLVACIVVNILGRYWMLYRK